MPRLSIRAQQEALFRALEPRGWRKTDDGPELVTEWWADEVWVLEAVWTPRDCRVFVTFVVDPGWEGPRAKGEGVYQVTASLDRPAQRAEVSFTLSRTWRKQLAVFLDGLDALRGSCPRALGE